MVEFTPSCLALRLLSCVAMGALADDGGMSPCLPQVHVPETRLFGQLRICFSGHLG